MPNFIEWSEDLSVKIPSIDNQHKKLISLINEVHDLLSRKALQGELGRMIEELKKYTDFHFKYEEALFSEYGYPAKDAHEKLHIEFIKIVDDLKQRASLPHGVMGSELLAILKKWIFAHIKTEDQAYSEYLVSRGVK